MSSCAGVWEGTFFILSRQTMTKETFYFRHDYNAHNDPKIEDMMYEMGWYGYGLYWGILEKLAQETGTWKLRTLYGRIAFVFRVEETDVKKLIENY